MKSIVKSIIVIVLSVLTISCNNDDIIIESTDKQKLVGNFYFTGNHEFLAEYPIYDSINPYPIAFEIGLLNEEFLDTVKVESLQTDSLQIFLRDIVAKGNFVNDTFYFNYNNNAYTNVDELNGTLTYYNDSLFLFFNWRNGTNWGEETPFYGNVNAKSKF